MKITLDYFVDGWKTMDAAAIGEALSSPAAFAPMDIGGLFDAIIGAGAVAKEVAGLYAYSELVRDVRTALANRDIETINRLVQVAAVIGQWTAPTIAAADISTRVEVVTVTGTVTPHVESVELDHVDTAIAATIADAADHAGLFVVKNTSATGTESHTLTLTAGTFNGTNNVATLDARDEMLIVYFDSTGRGQVIVNVGTVVLS